MLRTRRSPWIILLGLATLAAALVATYVAAAWRWLECNIGGAPECEPASLWQLYAAAAGVPVAGVMVIESVRPVGAPCSGSPL
jgi:hypothetical protein